MPAILTLRSCSLILCGMAAPAVTNFATYARLLAAACRPGEGASAARVAAMARVGEEHARHFTHPGRARDDALALFWQVVPAGFTDPSVFAAGLDPAQVTERMVAAIRTSSLGPDFARAPLPEAFFRAVTRAMLEAMEAR